MGINFADEKVNVKSIPQFGSTRKILNPVEEEIKKSGLKIPKPEYERLSVENYMTKEEYKAFSSLSPSQQKRAFEVFKQSPEYKRFKKKLDAQSELLSKNVTDSVTFFDEKNKKNEQPYTDNQNYSYRINEQEASYSAMENTKKAGEQTAKKAAENGAKTAAQTGAAAGSGGASEIAKEATEAVKKYADTLKDASSQPESDPTDYQTEHSSDIAISKSGMGTIQKITAVIMAFAAALISQLGVILLPLLIVLAVVIVIVSLLVALISSIAGAVKDASSAQVIAGLYRQLLSDNTISYTQDVKDAAVNEQIEDYVNYLLAIMEVESHGIGTDVMQSSESAGLPPNSFKTPQESIAQGAKYFASCVMKASEKECDINTAIQAYNFGTGFIDYVAENGKVYTLDLAIAFAEEKSGGKQVAYKNQIAINYNGGWRYAYGNMFYAQLVNQYKACEEIEEENIQPGDLIFYKNETSNGEIGHVAIYLGNGKVFEAGDPIGIYSATDEWHTSNQLHIGRVKGIEDADSASDD